MKLLLWAILGLVVGVVTTFGIGLALPMILPISQAEGAYAMGLMFYWLPLGGVFGAVCGLIFGLTRRP